MKKYILIVALFSSFTFATFCQNFGVDKADSISYNNMKKALHSAQGKQKVDLLNSISEMSEMIGVGWDTVLMRRKYDTIKRYGNEAYELANKIGYKDGIAMALINLSQHGSPETIAAAPLKDRDIREKNIRKAIAIAEETKNYDILGKAYSALGTLTTWFQKDEKSPDSTNKAQYYFELAKNSEALANIYTWAAGDYIAKGNYEKAFEYGEKSMEYLKNENVKFVNWYQFIVQVSLGNMATLYTAIGDYDNAMNYLKESDKYAIEKGTGWRMDAGIASLFCEMHQYDSALKYWKIWRNDPEWEKHAGGNRASGYTILAAICIANKQYDSALNIHRTNIEWLKPFNNKIGIASQWASIGNVYNEKGNYDSALFYEKKGMAGLDAFNDRTGMMNAYKVLSSIYHHFGNNDSAYEYLLKHDIIKDSIDNKQFLLRMYNSKKDAENEKKKAELGLLMKDNKIKQQQLKEEAMLKNYLFIFLVVLVVAGFFIFRNLTLKRKNDQLKNGKQQAELQEQAIRLEMQALRAQMNPHFIFNCLSSINCFILENETEKASDYLTRFSRLIRMVLTNSEKALITLDEELKMLKLYLDMERLRFENFFDYNITYTNDVEAETVLVPPLLLQPFCENAIWHGLMNKDGKGHLTITIMKENDYLNCVIRDDGIGRAKAGELNKGSAKKEKSMGLKITTERLSLFNQDKEGHTFYEIDDVTDENGAVTGTKVSVRIRHKNLMEAVA